MFKLKMFNIDDEKTRENQKRFIEVLLIIGGIIGGIQVKETAILNPSWSNIIYGGWGTFLMGSLLYYYAVSFLQKSNFFLLTVFSSIFSVSVGFSIIVILPFISAKYQDGFIFVFGLLTFTLISLALYQGREESGKALLSKK